VYSNGFERTPFLRELKRSFTPKELMKTNTVRELKIACIPTELNGTHMF
jgi:hypothetical protein